MSNRPPPFPNIWLVGGGRVHRPGETSGWMPGSDIGEMAERLGARWVVMEDPDYPVWKDPLRLFNQWAVYDLRKAHKNDPFPGQTGLPWPTRTFHAKTPDAAIMWALHRGDK